MRLLCVLSPNSSVRQHTSVTSPADLDRKNKRPVIIKPKLYDVCSIFCIVCLFIFYPFQIPGCTHKTQKICLLYLVCSSSIYHISFGFFLPYSLQPLLITRNSLLGLTFRETLFILGNCKEMLIGFYFNKINFNLQILGREGGRKF